MIGERSIYRKIQAALDIAKEGRSKSIRELEENIYSLSPINFCYTRIDKEKSKRIPYCSKDSIRRIIKICEDLNLINEKGKLTESVGFDALDESKFDKILSKQILKILKQENISLEKISSAIKNNLLQANPVILPTSDAIWNALGQPFQYEHFSSLLTLLGHSRALAFSQRKIFLP